MNEFCVFIPYMHVGNCSLSQSLSDECAFHEDFNASFGVLYCTLIKLLKPSTVLSLADGCQPYEERSKTERYLSRLCQHTHP